MECPTCKDPEAYVGLQEVDCLNQECPCFNESYLATRLQDSEEKFDLTIEGLGVADDFYEILSEMWVREVFKSAIPMAQFEDNNETPDSSFHLLERLYGRSR